MAAQRIRLTTPVRIVLDALAHADPDSPLWGYKLTELTGLGSGTIYPIMERLEAGNYVVAWLETPKPANRPPRRVYDLTNACRQLSTTQRAAGRRPAHWPPPAPPGPPPRGPTPRRP